MKTFTVKQENFVSNNRIEFGTKETWYHSTGVFHNSYKAIEPELVIKNAPPLPEGTVVELWNGKSDGSTVDCNGIAITPDGNKYHFTGYKDNGIRTGHPPVLFPVMKKKWTCHNSYIQCIELWKKGDKYYKQSVTYKAFGDEVINQTLQEVDLASIDYPYELAPTNISYEEYEQYRLWETKKVIEMRDTDEYLID